MDGQNLVRATGLVVVLSDGAAEEVCPFTRVQLAGQALAGRCESAQHVEDVATAIDRLTAFSGRTVITV